MSDTEPGQVPTSPEPPAAPQGNYGAPPAPPVPATAPGQPMVPGAGPVGQIRGTGKCILLTIVTIGIYALYWYYKTHDEMKKHSGDGLGGVLALVIAWFIGIVMPYITSSEVGNLYRRAGREAPVSGTTGLWYFPGVLILVGPIVWFVKTNGALNEYWKSQGAVG